MKALRSIRWRLQLWYGALFAVALGGLGFAAFQVERSAAQARIDEELQRRVLDLLGQRARAPGPPGPDQPLRGQRPPPPGVRPPPGPGLEGLRPPNEADFFSDGDRVRSMYFVLWRRAGPRVASALTPAGVTRPEDGAGLGVRQRGVWRECFMHPAPEEVVLVGRSVEHELAEWRRLAWLITASGVGVFGLALASGWWLVGRALRPIQEISDTAAMISTGDLSRRINPRDAESELGQLAGVLNATFARLEAAFAQQARFTADAAHELRTPVTVILTHTQNALGAPGASEEHREAFEACERAAQRMRRLTESLLRLARLDAGQEAMQRIPFDLASLARDCAAALRPLAEKRGMVLGTELESAASVGDVEQIGRVITNLLTNAIYHGRERGRVRVATRHEAGRAVITVSDDGPGIPPEHRANVFRRFYRADPARTGAAGQTGLGLAISKAIVDAHNGTIEVGESPEGGAAFTVRLPGN